MPQPLSFHNKVQSVSQSISLCLSLSLSVSVCLSACLPLSLSLHPSLPPPLSLSRTECPNRDSCLGLYLCVKYFRPSKRSVLPFLSRPLVMPETTTNTLFFTGPHCVRKQRTLCLAASVAIWGTRCTNVIRCSAIWPTGSDTGTPTV